jgi:hypothetical protein
MRWQSLLIAVVVSLAAQASFAAADRIQDIKNWVDYRAPDGSFSISFPAPPKKLISSQSESGLTISITDISVGGFGLTIREGLAVADANVVDALLDRMAGPKGANKPEYVRAISLGAVPGRENLMFVDKAWLYQRFYWTGTRLYNLMVITPTRDDKDALTRHFFDSFRLK